MIKFEKTAEYGIEAAVRGMRNPFNSWEKSDSCFCPDEPRCEGKCSEHIGLKDKSLMHKLIRAGADHRKFMRMISVSVDITAPLYWWKQFDTYKVGTVANSCSTMHKIADKEFTLDDFSHEHISGMSAHEFGNIIEALNLLRDWYISQAEKEHWYAIIQLLPESYNQKRTVVLNYEVLRNIYHSRKNHKLDEWRDFCKWAEELKHGDLISCADK